MQYDMSADFDRHADELYEQDGGGYEMAEDEISIDLFCGAGGTSTGIKMALGESPMFALNHNHVAIGVHDANHPDTIHLESDVFAMDPAQHIPADKRVGLLTASPSCVHFSTARGGKPVDREIRDQAWVVCNWAEHPEPRYRPRMIMIENVREFLTWCPVDDNGRIIKRFIDKDGLGSIFKEWRDRLIAAGYDIRYGLRNAADYGVATKRKRLMIVARNDGLPIRAPKVTHGPRDSAEVKAAVLKPYDTAAKHIDFTIRANPIMMYPEDAKAAGCKRPLAENSLRRIAAGVEIHVINSDEPYIIPYYGSKQGEKPRMHSINDALPTQTTENRFALVNPVITPVTHSGAPRFYGMDSQLPTITCARRGELSLIGAVSISPPADSEDDYVSITGNFNEQHGSPFFIGAGGGEYAAKPRTTDAPINTITCHSRQAVIIPSLIRVNHGDVDKNGKRRGRSNHDILEPLPTQPTSNEFALVSPKLIPTPTTIATMIQTGYGERDGQRPRCLDIREPIGTLVAGGGKHAVVSAELAPTDMSNACFIMNNNTNRKATAINDPVPTMTTGNQQAVTSVGMKSLCSSLAFVAQDNFTDVGASCHDPISTLTTSFNQRVVTTRLHQPDNDCSVEHRSAVFMAQNNADNKGHPITEPISTMTTAVSHQALVTSHITTMRQNVASTSLDEPLGTFCAAGNHHAEIRTSMVKYYGQNNGAQHSNVDVPIGRLGLTEEQRFEAWWVARFLEVYGTMDQGNPRTAHLAGPRPAAIGRDGSVLWTIEMRMLVPKEAFSASSFPEEFEFERMSDGTPTTKTQQMALVGNAVPPGLACAVISANMKPKRSIAAKMRLKEAA